MYRVSRGHFKTRLWLFLALQIQSIVYSSEGFETTCKMGPVWKHCRRSIPLMRETDRLQSEFRKECGRFLPISGSHLPIARNYLPDSSGSEPPVEFARLKISISALSNGNKSQLKDQKTIGNNIVAFTLGSLSIQQGRSLNSKVVFPKSG